MRRRHFRPVVAIVACVALSVGLLSAQSSPAQAEDVIDLTLEGSVPLIESPELQVPESATPVGDFQDVGMASPMHRGRSEPATTRSTAEVPSTEEVAPLSFDEGTSELIEQTEFTNTFENVDGTFTTQVGQAPLNAVDNEGEWGPIETVLQHDGDVWATDSHPLDPSFAETADDGAVFEVDRGGYRISFTLEGAQGGEFEREYQPRNAGDDSVTYPEVFDDVDLEFDITQGGVKETLVLADVPAADESFWVWRIKANALTLSLDENNSILFINRYGEVEFHIPTPVMWDSSGVPGESDPALENVQVHLYKSGPDWMLALTPDRDWLADDARVYPVSIDPSIQPGASAYYAYKSDGAFRNDIAIVGNARSGGDAYWRSVALFNFASIAGKQVTNSGIYLAYDDSGATGVYGGNIYDAACNGYSCAGEFLASYSVGSGATWAQSNPLNIRLHQLLRDGHTARNLFFTGTEAAGVYTTKDLALSLFIEWTEFPAITSVDSPSPANGAAAAPINPTLKVTSTNPTGTTLEYQYKVGTTSNVEASAVWTSTWSTIAQQQVPSGYLEPGVTYYWKPYVRDQYMVGAGAPARAGAVRSFTTNAPAPFPPQASIVPADNEVVTSLTPTLSAGTVTDPDGPVTYQFRITTGYDSNTGLVVASGWLPTPSWVVPAGTLQDGGTYRLSVYTSDGINIDVTPPWINRFTVNLRLGTSGPSPFDAVGPITVNLANGNGAMSFSSPTVNAVGGPMGLAFSYNSQQSTTILRGLTASYYDALTTGQSSTTTFEFAGKSPKLVRTDPAVSFQWGVTSPGPSVPADYFLVRWEGFISVPTAGTYKFGMTHSDGTRMWVNGTQVQNRWVTGSAVKEWGSNIAMPAGAVPIVIEFYEATGSANAELWAQNPAAQQFIVPSDWLSTKPQVLPLGWSTSTPIAGNSSMYTFARVTESSVVLTDYTGAAHTYARRSAGGYAAPVGEYGVLSLDAAGLVTLSAEDGTVYAFNAQGRISSVTSPADALKPGTPIVQYRPNGQADRISDPLSYNTGTNPKTYSREVRFVYWGDSAAAVGLNFPLDTDMSGNVCAVPAGFANPPAGMLCRIVYPGHVAGQADTTRLLYNSNGQLAQIIDPGNAITTFGYDLQGRLTKVIDPLGSDWLMANPGQSTTHLGTEIAYDGSGKVSSVTLPSPTGTSQSDRPQKSYVYGSGSTEVITAGLEESSSVSFDSSWRLTSATSPLGLTTSKSWGPNDTVLSTIDPQGLVSTTLYNAQDRPTDTFGPAPAECFGPDRRPTTPCSVTPAHNQIFYDGGLRGLRTTYYNNSGLAGAPVNFSMGLPGIPDGALMKDFGTSVPIAGVTSADNWSMTMTGLITFPTAGVYRFSSQSFDRMSVWIDDVKKTIAYGATTVITTTSANEVHRIRIQYWDSSATAAIAQLVWIRPYSSIFVEETIPGRYLSPDYGLATTSVGYDSTGSETPYTVDGTGYVYSKVSGLDGWAAVTPSVLTAAGGGMSLTGTGSGALATRVVTGLTVGASYTISGSMRANSGNPSCSLGAAGLGDGIAAAMSGLSSQNQMFRAPRHTFVATAPSATLRFVCTGTNVNVTAAEISIVLNGASVVTAAPTDPRTPTTVTSSKFAIPWLGQVTESAVDPLGVNLRTATTYETPGSSGWLRRLTKTMPAGVATGQSATTAGLSQTYWGDKQQLGSSICGLPATTPQFGFLKTTTGADPAGPATAMVTQFVYDQLGRTVGTKRSGDPSWTCVSYDSRGRPTNTITPDRTVTGVYAVGGDPLITSIGDPVGTITTHTDLLGRAVEYEDVWGTVSETQYEALTGRILSMTVTPPVGASSTQSFEYDADGKVESVSIDGEVFADPHYASNSLLSSIEYLNGTSLSAIMRNAANATTGSTWAYPTIEATGSPTMYSFDDFDAGVGDWAAQEGLLATSAVTHAGTGSAGITTEAGSAIVGLALEELEPGREYALEAWMAIEGAGTVEASIGFGVEQSPPVALPAPADGHPTWVRLSTTVVAEDIDDLLEVVVTASGATPVTALLDDLTISLLPADTPQPSVSDSVIRSQSGRIIQNTLTDGLEVETWKLQVRWRRPTGECNLVRRRLLDCARS
jgi:YD repeat-containing protein